MLKPLVVLAVLLAACAAPSEGTQVTVESPASPEIVVEGPINETCPRSGKPVAEDSLTAYRGYVVGFCNPHCRDDFAANVEECPRDREFFDGYIERLESRSADE